MRIKIIIMLVCAATLLAACNMGAKTPDATPEPVTQAPADLPTETPMPEATAVTHFIRPGELPGEPAGLVGDQDSSTTADAKRAPGGDRFTFTRFERPFNADTMDEYYPFMDILEAILYQDDVWIYASISVKGDESGQAAQGRYAVEFDLNLDGGGDWLVLASVPASTEWTTDGVEVWFDANDDVGGSRPVTTDENPVPGDGYEVQTFGLGIGNDPDFAWARISPSNPNAIDVAVKIDVLNGGKRFMVGLWAGQEDLNPAWFDLSDHFTHEQAGAADIGLEIFYPIKEISALDNTCRMAVGFQPTGNEPGLCPLPFAEGGDASGDAGCPADQIVCPNGMAANFACYCRP